MCRPETTAYACLHTLSTPPSPCSNRIYLTHHRPYRSSSNPRLRQRYRYMHSRCRRDSARGASILYLRMDIVCEECEKEGREVGVCDVLQIGVGEVEIQVLRGRTGPQGRKRGWGEMTEAESVRGRPKKRRD